MIRDVFSSILSKNSVLKKIENANEYTIYDTLQTAQIKSQDLIIVLEGITGTGQIGRGQGLFYLNTLIQQKNGLALIASNSGIVLQNKNVFTTETLPVDIQANYIILQIHEKELK